MQLRITTVQFCGSFILCIPWSYLEDLRGLFGSFPMKQFPRNSILRATKTLIGYYIIICNRIQIRIFVILYIVSSISRLFLKDPGRPALTTMHGSGSRAWPLDSSQRPSLFRDFAILRVGSYTSILQRSIFNA